MSETLRQHLVMALLDSPGMLEWRQRSHGKCQCNASQRYQGQTQLNSTLPCSHQDGLSRISPGQRFGSISILRSKGTITLLGQPGLVLLWHQAPSPPPWQCSSSDLTPGPPRSWNLHSSSQIPWTHPMAHHRSQQSQGSCPAMCEAQEVTWLCSSSAATSYQLQQVTEPLLNVSWTCVSDCYCFNWFDILDAKCLFGSRCTSFPFWYTTSNLVLTVLSLMWQPLGDLLR